MNKYLYTPIIIFIVISYILYKYYIKLKKSGVIRDMGSTVEFVFIYIEINLIIFLFNYFNYKYKMSIEGPKGNKGDLGRRGDPGEDSECDLCTKKISVFKPEPEVKKRKFLIDENNIEKPKKVIVRNKNELSKYQTVNIPTGGNTIGDTSGRCRNESMILGKNIIISNNCRDENNIQAPSYINGIAVKKMGNEIMQLQYLYSKEEKNGNDIIPRTELLKGNGTSGVFGKSNINIFKNGRGLSVPFERLADTIEPIVLVIGPSKYNSKKVYFPHNDYYVSPIPINNQDPNWADKFATAIYNQYLYVRRIDSNVGWGQNLILMARGKKNKTKYDDFTCPKNSGIYKMDLVYSPSDIVKINNDIDNKKEYSGGIKGIKVYCKDVNTGDIVRVRNQKTGELEDGAEFGNMSLSSKNVFDSVSCPVVNKNDKELPSLLSNVGSTYGLGINNLKFNKCSYKVN